MKKEIKKNEICDEIKKEIRFLYEIGVGAEEMDYLMVLKMQRYYYT